MSSAGTESAFVDSRSEFSGVRERPMKRNHRRSLLTIGAVLFLSIILTSCGGGFFQHPSVSSMWVNPASATLGPSNTVQLTAYGVYSDGAQKRLSEPTVNWSSSDPSIATVTSPGGVVTGVSAGTATITGTTTVTVQGLGCQVQVAINNGTPVLSKVCYSNSTETLTASINVNISAGNVNRAVINTTQGSTVAQVTATAAAPATTQFYAYGNGDSSNDMTQAMTWSSSNPGVATVTSGLANGNGMAISVAPGTTNITASTTNSAGQVVKSQTIVLTVQ